MQTASINVSLVEEKNPATPIPNRLLLPILFLAFMLTSAKWVFAIAPWIAYTLMLRFMRQNQWKKSLLIGWVVTYVAGLIANYKVVPMPTPFLFVFFIVVTGVGLIPYALDKWLTARISHLLASFVFPTAMVTLDYIASQGGSGTWGNIAYLQFSNIYLMQVASVTGIWGISFMIYWFASVANYAFENRHRAKQAIGSYSVVFLLIMVFGFVRLQWANSMENPKVKVAGITIENLPIMETMYECETGESIQLEPTAFQSDPDFAKVFSVMGIYTENPTAEKFAPVKRMNEQLIKELYTASEKAIQQGAKIIAWSEAIVMTIKPEENNYIEEAQAFAKSNQIWFFFPMAAIIPGKIIPGTPFIENKVLTINPAGKIVNTYFKNIPVGGVEPCFPGDGNIPVFDTEYGRLSPVICYDADFPQLLKQTGQKGTQLLIVPSGDWHAIKTTHMNMAIARGIENGVAVLRPVSKGKSVTTDNYGQILAQDDFFDDNEHLLIAEVPIRQISTIYATIGDAFVYVCIGILLMLIVRGIFF